MSSPTSSSSSLPTTRSRTLLFISYRDSSTRSTRFSRPQSSYDEPDQPADENEHLITRHLTLDLHLPPKWYVGPTPVHLPTRFISSHLIGLILPTKSEKSWPASTPNVRLFFVLQPAPIITPMQVSALEKLHAKRALPGFADRSAEEREIELATANITNVTRLAPMIRRASICSRLFLAPLGWTGLTTMSYPHTAHHRSRPFVSSIKQKSP